MIVKTEMTPEGNLLSIKDQLVIFFNRETNHIHVRAQVHKMPDKEDARALLNEIAYKLMRMASEL